MFFILLMNLLLFLKKPRYLLFSLFNRKYKQNHPESAAAKDQKDPLLSVFDFFRNRRRIIIVLLSAVFTIISLFNAISAAGDTHFRVMVFVTCECFGVIVIFFFYLSLKIDDLFVNLALSGNNEDLRPVCLSFFLDILYVTLTLLFSKGQQSIWFFHFAQIIILIISLIKLTRIIYSTVRDAIFGKAGHPSYIFRLVLGFIILQIAVFSLIMHHGIMVSYRYNTYFKTDNHMFEFYDQSENPYKSVVLGGSILGGSINEADSISTDLANTDRSISFDPMRVLFKSYYFVTTTFTSVGYGDVIPVTILAKLFSMFVSIYGYVMAAAIIGTILGGISQKKE